MQLLLIISQVKISLFHFKLQHFNSNFIHTNKAITLKFINAMTIQTNNLINQTERNPFSKSQYIKSSCD